MKFHTWFLLLLCMNVIAEPKRAQFQLDSVKFIRWTEKMSRFSVWMAISNFFLRLNDSVHTQQIFISFFIQTYMESISFWSYSNHYDYCIIFCIFDGCAFTRTIVRSMSTSSVLIVTFSPCTYKFNMYLQPELMHRTKTIVKFYNSEFMDRIWINFWHFVMCGLRNK